MGHGRVPWKGPGPGQKPQPDTLGSVEAHLRDLGDLACSGDPIALGESIFLFPSPGGRPLHMLTAPSTCHSHLQTEAVPAKGEVLHQRVTEVPGQTGGAASAAGLRHLRS